VFSPLRSLLSDRCYVHRSAVDAHTALHIYDRCLKGPLLAGRTVVLISHHVQLCVPGASYIVRESFQL
jgi:hypothetical protein